MSELRVMSWNVQNLFVPSDPDGPDTATAWQAKLASLATVIDVARPHLLGLQEVGTPDALYALQAQLGWKMPYSAVGVPDARGIRVAFLSTRIIHNTTHIGPFPAGLLPIQVGDDPPGPDGPRTLTQVGRGGLQVTIRANNQDLRVVNCHLKSKLLTFPGGRFSTSDPDERARFGAYALYRRASEATTLRAHLNGVLKDQGRAVPLLLLGDMNDETDAATTQILNGTPGSEIGSRGFEMPDQGDGTRLFNLAPLIPAEQRYSRIYRGRPELIDHIFASHYLASHHRIETVQTITAQGAALPSMDDTPTHHPVPGSDHAALAATFTY